MTSEDPNLQVYILDGSEIHAVVASLISWHERLSRLSTIVFHLDHKVLKNIELVVRSISSVNVHEVNLTCFIPSRRGVLKFTPHEDWDIKIYNFNTRSRKRGWLQFPNQADAAAMIEFARRHRGLVN